MPHEVLISLAGSSCWRVFVPVQGAPGVCGAGVQVLPGARDTGRAAFFPCWVEEKLRYFSPRFRKAWVEPTGSVLFSWAHRCAAEPQSARALLFLHFHGTMPTATGSRLVGKSLCSDVDRVLAFCPAGGWSSVDLGPEAGSPASPASRWSACSGRGTPASS